MQHLDLLLQKMIQQADTWEKSTDRRYIFLRCYSMMSTNMVVAIREGKFEDSAWVSTLMQRFADYYFVALEAYENRAEDTSRVWRQAHDAAQHQELHVLQNLLLGVNAHINYDLPLSLYDCLCLEWANLDDAQRRSRQNDHETVNAIISSTIDTVQDTVVEPASPIMAIVDQVFGRMDEWLLSQLIISWRHDVWNVAMQMLEAPEFFIRETIRKEQEQKALEKGEGLLRFKD
jgi:Family of unknown function (DUF5995)